MTIRRKLLIFAGPAVLLGAGALFAAQRFGGGHGPFGSPEHRLEMAAILLDLTDAQKATAKQLFEQARNEARPLAEQMRQGHEQMRAAIQGAKPDAELAEIARKQGELGGQIGGIYAKSFSRFYAQLTPAQKAKANKLHDQMRDRFRERWMQHGGEVQQ